MRSTVSPRETGLFAYTQAAGCQSWNQKLYPWTTRSLEIAQTAQLHPVGLPVPSSGQVGTEVGVGQHGQRLQGHRGRHMGALGEGKV